MHLLSGCLLLVMAAQAWRHDQQQLGNVHILTSQDSFLRCQQQQLQSVHLAVATILLAAAASLVAAAMGVSAQGKHGLICQQGGHTAGLPQCVTLCNVS